MNSLYLVAAFIVGLVVGALIAGLLRRQATKNAIEQKAAKLLSTKQEAFIAIASHYLLTPISVIQSAVIRLSEKPNLELSARIELYDTIISGEKRLYIIAEQMLLTTKLINGQLDISPQVGYLHTPVFEALKELAPIAAQKKITFHTDIKQTPPIECQFDAKQLKIATVALLDNAIKFSHEKQVVTVSVLRERNSVLIKVADDGIGLTPEQLAHATEKFYRGTPPYVFDYEGMGLGLHVASVIMEAHGGDLTVQSPGQNKGSVTTLILPLT